MNDPMDPGAREWLERSLGRYRRLLRLWPRDFRDRFGAEMTETFGRLLRRARAERGMFGVWAAWAAATRDAIAGGLRERVRALSGTHGGGHDRRGGDWMGDFMADVRFAIRSLTRRPVLAVTAIVTLALGIGANAAVFSIVNGLLFAPLPYDEPDQLVSVFAQHHERGWDGMDMNITDAWDLRSRAGVFTDLAVSRRTRLNLTGGDQPEVVSVTTTTHNVFRVVGRTPAVGRDFQDADTEPGAPQVAILSDGFWERRFARDPGVIGEVVQLDGTATTIVGIMPERFFMLGDRVDLWVPYRFDPATAADTGHDRDVIGRLRPGLGESEADRAVTAIMHQLEVERPETNRGWTADVVPIRRQVAGDYSLHASAILMVVVGFVLLMACVNVANLLLARASTRRGELALRAALGADRGRILRQLLTESTVLALFGGLAGAVVAWGGNRFIQAGLPPNMSPLLDFSLNGNVLVFTVVVSLLSAFGFGIVPAFRAAGRGAEDLKEGGRGGPGHRSRFGSSLVVIQTALAVVLLVGGGIMGKSVLGVMQQDFGWNPDRLLTISVGPSSTAYPSAEEFGPFHDRILERIRALPAVEAAGAIHAIPLGNSNWSSSFTLPGRPESGGREFSTRIAYASPGYFEAMEIELLRGRDLAPSDMPETPNVVVVNEIFAERYFPGTDPLGQTVQWGDDNASTVIGVVENHIKRGVERGFQPSAFRALAQRPIRGRILAVRTAGPPLDALESIKQAVWEIDPDQPVASPMTMETLVQMRVAGFRLLAELMAAFALISLLLGSVGIYGVTAYSVSRRTSEIGLRMALGADAGSVRRLVVRQGMRRALLGLGLGTVLALLMGSGMSGILFGVSPRDPFTFSVVVGTIFVVAVLGSYLPARRASAVDPVRALSAE